MDSLKRNYYLGFSKTTAIPSLEKVSEIKADGKPFSPPPPWQLQDNEPAASAWSLRQTPPLNILPNLRQREVISSRTPHRRCRVASEINFWFLFYFEKPLKNNCPMEQLILTKKTNISIRYKTTKSQKNMLLAYPNCAHRFQPVKKLNTHLRKKLTLSWWNVQSWEIFHQVLLCQFKISFEVLLSKYEAVHEWQARKRWEARTAFYNTNTNTLFWNPDCGGACTDYTQYILRNLKGEESDMIIPRAYYNPPKQGEWGKPKLK